MRGFSDCALVDEGWVEGSPLNVVLVSRPIIWGPKLEHCQLDGRHVQVLWLFPIHESEREYKRVNGLDALEELFEATSFDYLDPFRPAVA